MKLSQKEATFQNEVLTRFELFKSLFLTLPFQRVKHTGTLLPFFTTHCEKGVEEHLAPEEIIDSFLDNMSNMYRKRIVLIFFSESYNM